MNFYKKAILTLSGAGMMLGCTHKELETGQGVIIDMRVRRTATSCILDMDGDGLADRQIAIMDTRFPDYVSVGDTIRYKTKDKDNISLSVAPIFGNSHIVDVNGRTLEELRHQQQKNLLRDRWGQEKQR